MLVLVMLHRVDTPCGAGAGHDTLLCGVDSGACRISALYRVRIVAIAAANKHSAAVSSSGECYTWG